MALKRFFLPATALVLMVTGCQHVPDYLVEGRLPFSKKTDTAVAQNDTPPPVAAPAAAPKADKSHGWHLWPHKDGTAPVASAALVAETPPPPAASPTPPPLQAAPAPVVAEAPPPPPAEAPPAKKSFWPTIGGNRTPPSPPIAGGYSKAGGGDVDAAVAYAMHESPLYELKGVKSAQMQIVAGRNYELCLKVRQIDHEANPFHIRLVAAKVFEGLDGHYELTSWQEVNSCG